jgi:hypothetical protein
VVSSLCKFSSSIRLIRQNGNKAYTCGQLRAGNASPAEGCQVSEVGVSDPFVAHCCPCISSEKEKEERGDEVEKVAKHWNDSLRSITTSHIYHHKSYLSLIREQTY